MDYIEIAIGYYGALYYRMRRRSLDASGMNGMWGRWGPWRRAVVVDEPPSDLESAEESAEEE